VRIMINTQKIAQRLLTEDTTVSTGGTVPSSGYCVADHGISAAALTLDEAIAFVESDSAAPYFGSWHDSDTGRIYLDVVDVIDSLEIAITIATSRHEIAIFDLDTMTEIRI
jgi:hypothetical protein